MNQSSDVSFGDVAVWNYRRPERIKVNQGGTWSGKTWGILQVIFRKSLEDKTPKLTSIVSCTLPHLKKGALRDWKKILEMSGAISKVKENKTDHLYVFPNGSKVEFFSADDPNKMRGGRRDRLFVNECNLIDYESYRQLAMRTREEIYLDYNPVGEFWVHEKVIGREGVAFGISTYQNNKFVPENVKRDIESLKETDPELYRIYALGLTGKIQGLIFTNVDRCRAFPSECKKVGYGLDFGFSNDPTALVRMGVLHGNLYGEELIYETGLTNRDIAKRMEALGVGKSEEIYADSAEPKSIEELRRMGWNIRPAKKGADSIRHGVDLIKQYPVKLTSSSVNWLKEAKNYKWAQKGSDMLNKPIDRFNHCWDAARYYATMKLSRRPKIRGRRRVRVIK